MKHAVMIATARTPVGVAFNDDRLSIGGGSIFIGHPDGMAGACRVGHVPIDAKRRGAGFAAVSMVVGGDMGAAGLFEVAS